MRLLHFSISMSQVSGAGERHNCPLFRFLFHTLLSPSWFTKCITLSDMLFSLSVVFKYRNYWVWENEERNGDLVPWEKNTGVQVRKAMGIGMFLVTDQPFIFLSFLYFSVSTYTCVYSCTHTVIPVRWVRRWSVRHERMRLQQPSVCSPRAIETLSSSLCNLFAYTIWY